MRESWLSICPLDASEKYYAAEGIKTISAGLLHGGNARKQVEELGRFRSDCGLSRLQTELMLTGSKRSLATKNVGARTCPISKDSGLVMPASDEDLVRAERLAAKQSRELVEVQAELAKLRGADNL